eukprot:TRINITY_DN8964_c0_g4_i1.p1 TRINITY_DN8964_c0_g4~~TRINITY_DN8964_c0_g4_i1.p1  ORF type:complete len:365 (+),score=50.76 TRINITY_DN8964_c0_g4_i1:51-1097(+)
MFGPDFVVEDGEETNRCLGTVDVIRELREHPGADRLELAEVRGWQVIVGKGEYKQGDRVVYLEVDSIIPEKLLEGRKEHEIMKNKRFRVKTIKLRGEISQGLILPCELLPDPNVEIGTDVTTTLGLAKYEPPMTDNTKFPGTRQLGDFPKEVPKTDLKRVQNIVDLVPKLEGRIFTVSEKIDGASMTVLIADGVFKVCSKNTHTSAESKYGLTAENLKIEEKMRSAKIEHLALQGELVGPTVSGNRYRLKDLTIRFFAVYHTVDKTYLPTLRAIELVESLGLNWVPVLKPSFSMPLCTYTDLVSMADGKSTLSSNLREGLVFVADPQDGRGRVSFKAISNEYLLKYSL